MPGLFKAVSKAKDRRLSRTVKNRKSKATYMIAKGQYIKDKAISKNTIKTPILKYKNKKRALLVGGAEAADTQNTVRRAQEEETKRAEIRAKRDIALGDWANQMGGNPSTKGAEGSKQDKSTTSITQAGYTIPKGWNV